MVFKTRTLAITAIIIVVISGLMYGYLYMRDGSISPMNTASDGGMPLGKVAASRTPDGTYAATIHSIMTTPEDTILTFTPVDVSGTTVTETGEPDFTAPVSADTKVILVGQTNATAKDLTAMSRIVPPVFDVTLMNGNITAVIERELVSNGKG